MIKVKHISTLIFFSLVLLFSSCEKENHPGDYHLVETLEVTEINAEGATLRGEITYNSDAPVIEYGFIWSAKKEAYPINFLSKSVNAVITDEKFSLRIDSTLIKDVTYYVRAYIKTDTHTVYGNSIKFKSMGSTSESL